MKQKKKACGSAGMGLVLMKVKKEHLIKQRIARREEKKRSEGRQKEQSRYRTYRTQNKIHTNTLVLSKYRFSRT
ncbi:hypothetical protein AGMMS50233_06130 [Endomicrobiia bacterium]|nr:hypothetical protein AGMMS50233_06130 [Endomicrobiia bacterium]